MEHGIHTIKEMPHSMGEEEGREGFSKESSSMVEGKSDQFGRRNR
jgi:hypothetical protein